MRSLLFLLLFSLSLSAQTYSELSKKIIRELNYIYQDRAWNGGTTFAKETKYRYRFRTISDYEIEITQSIDGVCQDEPFIIDLRRDYYVELEEDNKCNPALIISYELDIIYLLVKDRCGHFGGFNLYKRAENAAVLLKSHFYEASRLKKKE